MSLSKDNTGYNKDFYAWIFTQADFLKNKEFSKLDINNLVEEIESLGKSDKRSMKSQLRRLLMHLLKKEYQPERKCNSWISSIIDAEQSIKDIIIDSPSLKNELIKMVSDIYEEARKDASKETGIDINKFPKKCPWTLDELLKHGPE